MYDVLFIFLLRDIENDLLFSIFPVIDTCTHYNFENVKDSWICQNITAQIHAQHKLFVTILWQYQKQISPFKFKFTELEFNTCRGLRPNYEILKNIPKFWQRKALLQWIYIVDVSTSTFFEQVSAQRTNLLLIFSFL